LISATVRERRFEVRPLCEARRRAHRARARPPRHVGHGLARAPGPVLSHREQGLAGALDVVRDALVVMAHSGSHPERSALGFVLSACG
jgi:hypothetical protein